MQISMIDRKENTDYCHSIHIERKESQNNTLINTSYTQTKQVCTKQEEDKDITPVIVVLKNRIFFERSKIRMDRHSPLVVLVR